MNSKTISKIVVSAFPVMCLSMYNVSDCYAGELLRAIQAQQRKLPHVTANQVMQNVLKSGSRLVSLKNAFRFWIKERGRGPPCN